MLDDDVEAAKECPLPSTTTRMLAMQAGYFGVKQDKIMELWRVLVSPLPDTVVVF